MYYLVHIKFFINLLVVTIIKNNNSNVGDFRHQREKNITGYLRKGLQILALPHNKRINCCGSHIKHITEPDTKGFINLPYDSKYISIEAFASSDVGFPYACCDYC